MAPKTAPSIFHPKKKIATKPNGASPQKAPSTPVATKASDEDESSVPNWPYQEFRLMSSALNGWKYDVMKFDSRKAVEISTWKTPIKLNRKEPKRDEPSNAAVPEAVGPMLGPDGKAVIGADGRTVMVDAAGRPIHSAESYAAAKDAKANGTNKKKFQKKTRQVYSVPEAVRRLRREERYPWVMEAADKSEVWVGKMEDVGKSDTRAFFMPAANDVFKFVPAHRWYKFHKKMNHYVPTLEEAEKVLDKMKKNKDPQVWLLRNRNGQAASSATSAIFKAESEGRSMSGSNSLVHSAGQSLGPGGRRLKAVDNGGDLFGDDDQEGQRRKKREFGEEGDLDEGVYDNEFADDEEKMDMDDTQPDDEAKELEERLKREYKSANKTREGYVDESEEESEPELNKEGRALKKLIRNKDKNEGYGSDDDSDPYASSVEEEEEELPVVPPVPAVPAESPIPKQEEPAVNKSQPVAKPSAVNSRATSPVPGLGGHSMVAKRATSPKLPKLKTNNSSRGNSPLVPSRAASPMAGSRATSPVTGQAASPTAQSPVSPMGGQKPNNKRKATDDHVSGPPSPAATTNGNGLPSKPKKRKAAASTLVPAGELEDRMVIDWLRSSPSATTRDCIHHFTPYLTDEAKKAKFTKLIREVAQLKNGVLVLRNVFRSGSVAPSPAPTPAA